MLNLVRFIQQKQNIVIEMCHRNLQQGLISKSRKKNALKGKGMNQSVYFYKLLKGFF